MTSRQKETMTDTHTQPSKHTFRIGACDWSLGSLGVDAIPLAQAIGLDGIEVDAGPAGDILPLSTHQAQVALRKRALEANVAITTICAPFLNDFPLASDPRGESWLLQCLDTARATSADIVLMPFFGNGDLRQDKTLKTQEIKAVVQLLKKVVPKAEQAGITFGLETTLSASQQLDIIDQIGSPNVKVYYDIGNAAYFGYNQPDEIRELGARLCRIHFKDAGYLGEPGRIALAPVIAALRDIDYRGWLMLETNCPSGNPEADFKRNLATLRQVLAT
jgi:L-ribulose-5-phosphate 3-epimerase